VNAQPHAKVEECFDSKKSIFEQDTHKPTNTYL
jgi:hypothetical protein